MSSSVILAALVAASSVLAQADTPLASKHFEYTALPYMVDTTNGPRGIQTGYNLCNSTTEGPSSLCQTATVNSLDDFCIWGPPKPNSAIADTEGELVAWCTKPGRGTRIIPSGALTGVQFMQTPDYLQVTGRINQTLINIAAGDSGGEEDPHGADGRGNPLGSLVFSNGFPSNNGNNGSFQQVIEWHNFLGGEVFCIKVCDPAGAHAADYCQHIYDRIGCQYNAPAAYQDGVFEKCQGDNQDFPGVYTGSDGKVTTYSQPPESLGAIQTIPYTARIPASSNCQTFSSANLYAAAASVAPNPNQPTSTSAASSGVSGSAASRTSGGSASAASATNSNSAHQHHAMAPLGLIGAAVGVALFA
ncbi:hypothetical protein JB92DRAFT_2980797 [Gautieria morchelliformis]|nr:hypothetical protein JB92DRAFT_2980797 [Gautieria morchelliformis]